MNSPKVSICIPAYEMHGKGALFLAESLDRIKTQTYQNYEVVISDNSVTDMIFNVYQTFKDLINIKYIKHNGRKTMSPNTNNAIRYSDGDLIKILFLDDFFFDDNSLSLLLRAYFETKRPWIISACTHSVDGQHFFNSMTPYYTDKIFLGNNTISSPSVVMFERQVEVLFDEELTWLMDCDFYKRMYKCFGLPGICEEVTVVNRVGTHQVSQSGVIREIQITELRYIMQKYPLDISFSDRIKIIKYLIPRQFRDLMKKFT